MHGRPAEGVDPEPAQLGHVRPATEQFAEVANDAADVGSRATGDAQAETPALETEQFDRVDLDLALGRLSPDDRELVRLWAWERLTPREVAAVLDITSSAASIRLHRAKARLTDHLGAGKISPAARHNGDGRTEEVP